MSDSYLDHIPSQEREKIRKRMRSPEEYERLRDKVKGPEDLEREMQRNSEFAEAKLHLEFDPKMQEKAKDAISSFVKEQGMESAFESSSDKLKELLKSGKFEVTVNDQNREPAIAVKPQSAPHAVPTGKVSEVFHLKPILQQQVLATFTVK